MADFLDILASLAASGLIVHPQGHNIAGEQVGVPVHVDYRNAMEKWNPPEDWRKEAQIQGGGFGMQDTAAHLLSGTEAETPMRYANALYKLGYLSGLALPNSSGGGTIGGDVKNLERVSGNKNVDMLLGLSALADLIKANNPKSNWDMQFITPEGAPGLKMNWKW